MAKLDQREIHALREAAERAWGEDTRHANHQGHPLKSAGQCYVTSRWLQSRLGGSVGVKGGHYFWVSPDRSHVIDLTGDQFAVRPADKDFEGIPQDTEDEPWTYSAEQTQWRPGPPLYKQADHPLFRGFRPVETDNEPPRVQTFIQRADAAYSDPEAKLSKVADLLGADPYPAEEPQAMEDSGLADRYWHDQPDPDEREYRFVYANGQLHVSPLHSYEELTGHAGVSGDHSGPMAMGTIVVGGRNAIWSVNSNVGGNALSRVLKDYTKHVGWQWGGLTDMEGEPLDTGSEYAPKKSMYYAWDDETGHLFLSKRLQDIRFDVDHPVQYGRFVQQGDTIHLGAGSVDVAAIEAFAEYAQDQGLKIVADYPGGSQMNERMHTFDPMGEDIDQYNLGDMNKPDEWKVPQNNPEGVFKCNACGVLSGTWPEHLDHIKGHEMSDDQDARADDESKFPMNPNHDVPLPPHYWDRRPIVDPISSVRVASITEPGKYLEPLLHKLGWLRVAAGRWVYADQQPKDMIQNPVPFIYDIQEDKIATGHPGQRTSDIPGRFTPGGIVEGEYMPGGKVVIRTVTNMPYSTKHILDLWYWTYPHMEITGLEQTDDAGNTTKLASENVGTYIKRLVDIDPAASLASKALTQAGGKVYAVGGAVRDALLQKQPKDIDLMVAGLPSDNVFHVLDQLPGRLDITGKKFGVYRFNVKGHEVEVALPRTETSTGDKRFDFDVNVDHNLPVERDLERRDFTVNSMAVDLSSGQLIDPYGGAKDIETHTLDTTHPSSFEEDATRLVRALVASSRHGLVPTERLRAEIEANASRLNGEAREGIQRELDKLFASDNPAGAVRLAQETGLLHHILPEVADNFDFDQQNPHHAYTLGQHSLNVLENLQNSTSDPDLRLAGLLHDTGKPDSQWIDPTTGVAHYYLGSNGEGADHAEVGATLAQRRMRDLKYPVSRINRVRDLVSHHMYPDFSSTKGARKFLNRVGDHADDLMTLRAADREGKGTDEYQETKTPVDSQRALVEQVRSEAQPTNVAALAVNGNDLIDAGIPQGPEIGRVLQQLTDAVIEDPQQNTRDKLLDLAQRYVSQNS